MGAEGRWLFLAGFAAVAGSTLLSGLAYLGGGLRVGVGSLAGSVADPVTPTGVRQVVIEEFEEGTRENLRSLSRALRLFQAATVSLLSGVTLLTAATAILMM